MTNKKKIKDYDKLLQKYIDNQAFVKVNRTIHDKEENLRGVILSISKTLLLIQVDNEFRLDGFAIIKKDDFDDIRYSSFERTQRKIFKAEGLLNNGFGFQKELPLDNWTNIIKTLRKLNFHIIIESDNKDYLDFNIGQIVGITDKSVSVLNYSPDGIYDDNPTKIKLKKIRTLKFGDNYSTVFRKYLSVRKK